MTERHTQPAEGERAAVVGLRGQYGLAARIVVAKLRTLEWIRVADPEAGVADDFQFKAGPMRHALQVKWAQYPASFGWAELVNPSGATPSLMECLAEAWQRLRSSWSGPLEVHLCSNEYPSVAVPPATTPLGACDASPPKHFAAFLARSFRPLRDEIVKGTALWRDLEALPEVRDWRPAWDALRAAADLDDENFVRFIGDLVLQFGQQAGDAATHWDAGAADADIKHIGATLQALVADPARPLQLSRDEFLDRLGWRDRLRYRNPHTFPVPRVYSANEAARSLLMERLQTLPGGYLALVGPAGSGKSTLLATIAPDGHRVVRYYAFVPDSPDPLSARGEAESFLHDLALALDEAGLFRRGYGNDLRSQRAVVFDLLDQARVRWRDRREPTLIIVDGLDHIPREQRPARSLLEELPPPSALGDGVFIVLGTQTTQILPQSVRDALTADGRTVDLPPLAATEVRALADTAGPGQWLLPGQRDDLVAASDGHPLALTYLLAELNAIAESEPSEEPRRLLADRLLGDASAYGGDIERRYRGYSHAVGGDTEVWTLLGTVARLRGAVDLRWLGTWVPPAALDRFVDRTATFFRREGAIWRFIHNSFRRFLVEETARTAGTFDSERDRSFHAELADVCSRSGDDWLRYRDEEIAHRFLAGQYDIVVQRTEPLLLRQALLGLRPPATVRDQALLGLRAAVAIDDHGAFIRTLVFLDELWQREYVLKPDRVAASLVALGPPDRALDHLVGGGRLRVDLDCALGAAAEFARAATPDAAAEVLRVAGGLADIVGPADRFANRDAPDIVADWAEVTLRLAGLDDVLARLDDQLPLREEGPAEEPSPTADEDVDWEEERRRRAERERAEVVATCRLFAHARCFDVLAGVRDDDALAALGTLIDGEAPLGWRARTRLVRAFDALEDGDPDGVLKFVREMLDIESAAPLESRDDDEEGGERAPHLHLRAQAAELLMRAGLADASELDDLVPQDAVATWPSVPSGTDGLEPFSTILAVWRIQRARRSIGPPTDATAASPTRTEGRDAGQERFRRALKLLADIEGDQLAAASGRTTSPAVAGQADPIVRLLEVPSSQTRDWTGWYFVRAAAGDIFERLIRVAGRSGGRGEVAQLFTRFSTAWDNPDRAPYWSPRLQQRVLTATLDLCDEETSELVRQRLDSLEESIGRRPLDAHERVETWLGQAEAWSRAGDTDRAEAALQEAVKTSLGPGIHDDDDQLAGWLDWLEGVVGAVQERAAVLAVARRYASRLAAVSETQSGAGDAAQRLVRLIWRVDPLYATDLAEWLCDASVLEEADAIRGVVLAAADDARVSPDIVGAVAAEMLLPLLRQPPRDLTEAVERRIGGSDRSHALARLAAAEAVWSVPEESIEDSSSPSQDAPLPTEAAEGDAPPSPSATQTPFGARGLLKAMRAAENMAEPAGDWTVALEAIAEQIVPADVARALLAEASRLRLDGAFLGTLAAIAARAGEVDAALQALSGALARTPPQGWLRQWDGGTRLALFEAALRFGSPELVRLAANDLAGGLTSGAIVGQIRPVALSRIIRTLFGGDAVVDAWPDVEAYLDVFAPATAAAPEPRAEPRSSESVVTLLRCVAAYLGHPVRILDFGARRIFHEVLATTPADAETALAEAIGAGGWRQEAALHAVVTARGAGAELGRDLTAAIREAATGSDQICRHLANRAARAFGIDVEMPTRSDLPVAYSLDLPPLPERTAPELDRHGVPHLDPHDPQQLVAPFDGVLAALADMTGIDASAVMYHAAAIAEASIDPWTAGGHRAQASRLKRRGQLHTYRPWPYMAGRRATGTALAELIDAGVVDPGSSSSVELFGLLDETLIRVVTEPLDETTPLPWRRPGTRSYDLSGWCDEAGEAATSYAAAIGTSRSFVLAESSEWRSLEWGRPEETRVVECAHGTTTQHDLVLPARRAWESTLAGARSYPSCPDARWRDRELVVRGREHWTDVPWHEWLAIHPRVATELGWRLGGGRPFTWIGTDDRWRAQSIRRARGQLSHQPPGRAYCGEVWQVVLSNEGVAELRAVFGPLDRTILVTRTLPARPREGRMHPESIASSARIGTP